MRHRWRGKKLGRNSANRRALLRGLAKSLFDRERIQTTLPKAKELRPFAERLITISRKGDDLHARRRVLRTITDAGTVRKLFDTLSPRFSDRPGGYLRILKLGRRRGDAAEMAIVELVGSEDKITRRKRYLKKEKETKKTASVREKRSA